MHSAACFGKCFIVEQLFQRFRFRFRGDLRRTGWGVSVVVAFISVSVEESENKNKIVSIIIVKYSVITYNINTWVEPHAALVRVLGPEATPHLRNGAR